MNNTVRRLFKGMISLLDVCIPKRKDLWVFYITPHTSWDANLQCVFALAKEKLQVRCVVIHQSPLSAPDLTDTPSYAFFSLQGLWSCLRSGYIFFDHAMAPGMLSIRRYNVNLWHGVPIKKIRYFCKNSFPQGYLKKQSKNTSLLIASSTVDRLAMIASFQISPEKVEVTGIPRNDILLNRDYFMELLPYLTKEHEELLKLKNERTLILFAPTYRDNLQDTAKITLAEEDEKHLVAVLQKHNAVLGVRGHQFSQGRYFSYLQECGMAIEISTQMFPNTNLLLTEVDMLITDYSSIWVDYLLLERPILGFCPDYDFYSNDRGFLYEFDEIFPGVIAKSIKELAREVDISLSGQDQETSSKQKNAYKLFHKFNDGKNTERVMHAIQKMS